MQKHLNHFQKIFIALLNIDEKVEEKTRTSILLASLSSSYESLMTALLMRKSTIKMDEVTTVILQNEVLKWKNQASSSDGGSSTLTIFDGAGGSRWSDKGS